jgi:transforming growth factor-beta-induced protein
MKKVRTLRSARVLGAIGLATMGLAVAACGGDNESSPEKATTTAAPATTTEATTQENIVETAVAAEDFTTLTSLVEQAGLAETLSGEGPFTVFAPTDEAFAKVPQETLDALAADPEALKAVLLYHVVAGEARASDVAGLSSAETLNGESVELETTDGGVMVNDAMVVQADVTASNGVIHVIDEVLIP